MDVGSAKRRRMTSAVEGSLKNTLAVLAAGDARCRFLVFPTIVSVRRFGIRG